MKGTDNKIKGGRSLIKDDYYFCLRCDFQISGKRFNNIIKKPDEGVNKEAQKILNELLAKVVANKPLI